MKLSEWHSFYDSLLILNYYVMKTILNLAVGKCMLLALMLLGTLSAVAQDATENKVSVSTTSSNTSASGGTWYAAPWVWVVGAAVFILLLVAIVRGGGRRAD